MKKIKFYRNSIFIKFFLINVFLMFFSIIIFGNVLSNIYAEKYIVKLHELSEKQLKQSLSSFENILTNVETIHRQIMLDREIISFISAKNDDVLLNYKTALYLQNIKLFSDYFHGISVYNSKQKKLIPNKEYTRDVNDVYNLIDEMNQGCVIIQNSVKNPYVTRNNYSNILSIIQLLKRKDDNVIGNFILYDIKLDLVKKLTFPVQSENIDMFIFDEKEIILESNGYYNNKSMILNKIIEQNFNKLDKTFIMTDHDNDLVISYIKSEKYNFYIASAQPHKNILLEAKFIYLISTLLAIFLIFSSIILTFFWGRKIYNPFSNLLQKIMPFYKNSVNVSDLEIVDNVISELDYKNCEYNKKLTILMPLVKENYLQSLLFENKSSASDDTNFTDIIELNEFVVSKYYCIVLIKITKSTTFEKTVIDEILFSINNIVSEFFLQHYKLLEIEIKNDTLTFLIYNSIDIIEEKIIINLINSSIEFIDFYFGYEFIVSISPVTNNKNNLKNCFSLTQCNLNYAFYCPNQRIFTNHERNKSSYNISLETKIINAIIYRNQTDLEKNILDFCNELSQNEYNASIENLDKLINKLQKEFAEIITFDSPQINKYYSFAEYIKELKKFIFEISSRLNEKTNNPYEEKLNSIYLYVKENFNDSALNLEFFADKYNIGTRGLAKLFKQKYMVSFSDYLTSVRLEKAIQYLLTSKLTVNEISLLIGIDNPTYFYSLFKKKYKMTPMQFRKNNTL